MNGLSIRMLQDRDIGEIADAFIALGWNKPASQYERYLSEQVGGQREVFVAFAAEGFAGYLTIVWQSAHEPFQTNGIPEIVDFNVLPHLRRRGIGSRLMDEAERRIAERAPVAGIGVGIDVNYGAAQRLYVKRGYIPDGRGLSSHGRPVIHGQAVVVDDGLVLYFTKQLCS